MGGIETVTGDLVRPGTPDVENVTVEARERPARAPQEQERALDPAAAEVGVVVLPVDGGAGPVVLADRFDRARIVRQAAVRGDQRPGITAGRHPDPQRPYVIVEEGARIS